MIEIDPQVNRLINLFVIVEGSQMSTVIPLYSVSSVPLVFRVRQEFPLGQTFRVDGQSAADLDLDDIDVDDDNSSRYLVASRIIFIL